MSTPRRPPPRKNPVLRTRVPLLPPVERSRAALGLTSVAALGLFELQQCANCGAVQYPPREACHRCLTGPLKWTPQNPVGELISQTVIHHSQSSYFRERTPWRVGLVRLEAGVSVVAHLHSACKAAPSRVKLETRLDRAGQGVIVALPAEEIANMADDRQLLEMSCTPKFRRVLVADAKTRVGEALVHSLLEAGADFVWAGISEPWKQSAIADTLRANAKVGVVPLDLTNSSSVKEIAAEIGGRVDILINNAEVHRAAGIASRSGVELARAEMDVNYFGLLRLAQELGPAMRSRAADGERRAAAWVNVLSIFALSNFAPHGTYSASKAAARSLSQCLRVEMRSAGIRVVDVYPGPIDDEWHQELPPPKLAPEALARAIVQALEKGIEDVYPGDVAQDLLARWRENAKVLERELSLGY